MSINDFYKLTSPYTDLGFYKDFAIQLPNDLKELCTLQRSQILHPTLLTEDNTTAEYVSYWGDFNNIPKNRLEYEDDLYPTALSMLAELIRKDGAFNLDRKAEDKIHIICRGDALLLCAILKAKGYAARIRSGFDNYDPDDICDDHWICEYYNQESHNWILCDVDYICHQDKYDFDFTNVPRNKFMTAADGYLGIRNDIMPPDKLWWKGIRFEDRAEKIMESILRVLIYDFNSVMNNEIPITYTAKYIHDANFNLGEDELVELDNLAQLMLDIDGNFEKLSELYNGNLKFSTLSGGINR